MLLCGLLLHFSKLQWYCSCNVDSNAFTLEPGTNKASIYIEMFSGVGRLLGSNSTDMFMASFDKDAFVEERKANLFYPFASRGDWEVASWLFNSGLSQTSINKYLSLKLVRIMTSNKFFSELIARLNLWEFLLNQPKNCAVV